MVKVTIKNCVIFTIFIETVFNDLLTHIDDKVDHMLYIILLFRDTQFSNIKEQKYQVTCNKIQISH